MLSEREVVDLGRPVEYLFSSPSNVAQERVYSHPLHRADPDAKGCCTLLCAVNTSRDESVFCLISSSASGSDRSLLFSAPPMSTWEARNYFFTLEKEQFIDLHPYKTMKNGATAGWRGIFFKKRRKIRNKSSRVRDQLNKKYNSVVDACTFSRPRPKIIQLNHLSFTLNNKHRKCQELFNHKPINHFCSWNRKQNPISSKTEQTRMEHIHKTRIESINVRNFQRSMYKVYFSLDSF